MILNSTSAMFSNAQKQGKRIQQGVCVSCLPLHMGAARGRWEALKMDGGFSEIAAACGHTYLFCLLRVRILTWLQRLCSCGAARNATKNA